MQQTAGAWGPPATLWRCAGTKGTVWIEAGKVFVADRTGTRELAVTPDLALPPAPPAEEGARRADVVVHADDVGRTCRPGGQGSQRCEARERGGQPSHLAMHSATGRAGTGL